MKRVKAPIIGAGVIALALAAGCTGGGGGASSTPAEPSRDEKVVSITDTPGSDEDYVGALADSTLDVCEVKGGVLEVSGTVTNPESSVQSYRIYVSAMNGKDTRGLVQVDVNDVDASATADWATQIDLSDPNLECVLRVERSDS